MKATRDGATSAQAPGRGPRNQQTARAGEFFVAGELCRRGAYAVTFAGNMPHIDILASNTDQTKTIHIQVKTRRKGDWQTRIPTAEDRTLAPAAQGKFWVLVDIGGQSPRYWIVPEGEMLADMRKRYTTYLAKHGGQRVRSPGSTHWIVRERDVSAWLDKWESLGIFPEGS